MISRLEVLKAMQMLENPVGYLNCSAVHKQLAGSLEVYQRRGEYDGTIKSAIECLELAGYEIEGENA
jgi:hypothetical protein